MTQSRRDDTCERLKAYQRSQHVRARINHAWVIPALIPQIADPPSSVLGADTKKKLENRLARRLLSLNSSIPQPYE